MAIQLPLRKKQLTVASELGSVAGASRLEPGDADHGAGRGAGRGIGVRTVRVGDLAKRTGKTVRALHLYEEHGLLAPAQRSSGGYRLYSRDAELRVRWIDKLQQMGFSLTDIKQIVQDVDRSKNAPDAMQRVQDLFREKLDETREQLRRLTALEGELQASLSYLKTCDGCDTPHEQELLASCTDCVRHDCGHKPPELVLGFRVH